jgi:hypothetical protein
MSIGARLAHRRVSIHLLAAALAMLVVLVPLAFGGILPWSQTALQLVSLVAFAAAALTVPRIRDLNTALWAAAALLAVAAIGLIQTIPLPLGAIRAFSPATARLVLGDHAALPPHSASPAASHALSLAPGCTAAAALMWAAVATLLVAAAVAGSSRRARLVVGGGAVAAALFQILFGARELGAGSQDIWGLVVPPSPNRLRGTFVNPDDTALFINLALPLVFAWGWWAVRRALRERAPEKRLLLVAPPAVIWVTLFVGMAFTGSRAGLAAAVATTLFQGVLAASQARRWHLSVVGVGASAVGLGAVGIVGLQQGLGRWLGTSRYEVTWNDRLHIYAHALRLWERFPWMGSGLASFRDAFPLVSPPLANTIWHAHNDYIELLTNAGIAGALLVAVAGAVVVVRLTRALRDGERSEDRAAALAALGAVVALAIHSVFDFGLSLPANAVMFVVIVGAALGVPLDARE